MTEANTTLRVIDTGVLEGRLNIALGQALIEAHQAGQVPDTLRFLRFPPTALVGRHQVLGWEIDLAYCRAHSIGLARRITGGGAIFLDPGQLGWELVISRRTLGRPGLGEATRTLCEAAAEGLSALGIEAAYRPRNDIEVGGRKISGTGGFFDGDTLFFQGTVLVDLDPAVMVSALRVPREKLDRRSLDSAAERIVTLRQLLGEDTPALDRIQQVLADAVARRFGLRESRDALSDEERGRGHDIHREEIGRDDFVDEIQPAADEPGVLAGEHQSPGGAIRSYLRLEGPTHAVVREALITGDFFVTPPRLVYDLEAALRRCRCAELESRVHSFFDTARYDLLSVTPADFARSLQNALDSGASGRDRGGQG